MAAYSPDRRGGTAWRTVRRGAGAPPDGAADSADPRFDAVPGDPGAVAR